MPAAPIAGAGGAVRTPGVSPVLGGPGPGGPTTLGPVGGPGGMLRGPGQIGPGYAAPIWPVQPPYLPLGPLSLIGTPGIGPNGIGPIDARRSIYSVGEGSVQPYSFTNGYAASDSGRTGFIGPPAGSLRRLTSWYVRTAGSNANGGSTSSLTPTKSGTDVVSSNNSRTITSATANFGLGDVDQGIYLNFSGHISYSRIQSVTNTTTAIISVPPTFGGSNTTWAIGGAWADPTPFLSPALYNSSFPSNGVMPGDNFYIGAGVYRQVYVLGNQWGNGWSLTGGSIVTQLPFNGVVNIVGDVTGQFTGDAGMVQLTAYTTNDKTVPVAAPTLQLNGKSNLSFSNIFFVSGSTSLLTATVTTSQNISFIDSAFLAYAGTGNQATGNLIFNSGVNVNWLFDRCYFKQGAGAVWSITIALGNYDFDANIVFRNSVGIFGSGTLCIFGSTGTGPGHPGGVHLSNISIPTLGSLMQTQSATMSTVFPCRVYNCMAFGTGAVVNAFTLGQIVEDYNILYGTTPRTNVAVGAHSVSDVSYAPLFHFGQERIWLPPLYRALGEPMAGSPLLGFGNDGSQTPYDTRGPFNIRPAGGSSGLPAVGALERADTFVSDPTPIGNNTTPVKLTGPGYNDFLLPIGITEINQVRTVSIAVQWDANYGSPIYGLPALQVEAKPQMGVGQQTVSATGGSGSPHTITLSFTPTAAGVLNIRAISFDQSGVSVVEWDSFNVT